MRDVATIVVFTDFITELAMTIPRLSVLAFIISAQLTRLVLAAEPAPARHAITHEDVCHAQNPDRLAGPLDLAPRPAGRQQPRGVQL